MNLTKFNSLGLKEKGDLVFTEGTFIGQREYYNQKLALYDMGEFFAEVWYHSVRNEITRIDGINQNDKNINRYIDY